MNNPVALVFYKNGSYRFVDNLHNIRHPGTRDFPIKAEVIDTAKDTLNLYSHTSVLDKVSKMLAENNQGVKLVTKFSKEYL